MVNGCAIARFSLILCLNATCLNLFGRNPFFARINMSLKVNGIVCDANSSIPAVGESVFLGVLVFELPLLSVLIPLPYNNLEEWRVNLIRIFGEDIQGCNLEP